MTVTSAIRKVSFSCDGVVKNFDFPFKIFTKNELAIFRKKPDGGKGVVSKSEYSVQAPNNNFANGGTVKFTNAPAAKTKLVIFSQLEVVQTMHLYHNDRLPSEPIEAAFDRLAIICQQLQEQIDRCAKLDVVEGVNLNSAFFLEKMKQLKAAAANSVTEASQIFEKVRNHYKTNRTVSKQNPSGVPRDGEEWVVVTND